MIKNKVKQVNLITDNLEDNLQSEGFRITTQIDYPTDPQVKTEDLGMHSSPMGSFYHQSQKSSKFLTRGRFDFAT